MLKNENYTYVYYIIICILLLKIYICCYTVLFCRESSISNLTGKNELLVQEIHIY